MSYNVADYDVGWIFYFAQDGEKMVNLYKPLSCSPTKDIDRQDDDS